MSPETSVFQCPLCSAQINYHSLHREERVRCLCCLRMVSIPIVPATGTADQSPNNAAAWQSECQNVVVRLANLLSATKRELNGLALIELVRQLPRSEEEISKLLDAKMLLARCLNDTIDNDSVGEAKEFALFARRIAALSTERRELLEASVVGVIMGMGMVG